MARVKVVLGFVILAAMLKYVSNVDLVLQTNLLIPRTFTWRPGSCCSRLPGLYLLGFLRMEGVKPEETVGSGRLLVAVAFLIFAVSLLPGMFGALSGAPGSLCSACEAEAGRHPYRGVNRRFG